ncbi:MAG: hypothetical protein Rhims3KO_24760 [Hyphomicrobiales bacterium]
MSQLKTDGNYELIDPPSTLKSKVRMLVGRDAQVDPVEKAEKAIERLSANFADWMDEEVSRLVDSWQTNKTAGFAQETRTSLYRVAHDMRGQASTLGFPAVGRIAGIFCDILDTLGEDRVPDAFLEKYITAIRAITRETKRGEDNAIAGQLADELAKAGQELIEEHKQKTKAA